MKLRSQRALMFLQHGRHEDPLAELRTVELYIADSVGYRIRRIGSDGIITKVAGATDLTAVREGVPALTAEIGSIAQMQVGPDGALYLVEMHSASNRVRRIAPPPMAGVSIGEMVLPSEDGREAYVFSGVGKHLRTIDTRIGATLYQMQYDAVGQLAAVVNVDGDTTTIEMMIASAVPVTTVRLTRLAPPDRVTPGRSGATGRTTTIRARTR